MRLHLKQTISFLTGPDQDHLLTPIESCEVCTEEKPKFVERTTAQQAAIRYLPSERNKLAQEGKKFFAEDM